MTAKELAEMLDRREYGEEITRDEAQRAADTGLVVVYGYSNDNVEFAGAISDEVGAYGGATIYIDNNGVLDAPSCASARECSCPYFDAAIKVAKAIEAVWHNEGGPCWTFETDIPHETFTIMEDGEPWCIGIVFSMKDLEWLG